MMVTKKAFTAFTLLFGGTIATVLVVSHSYVPRVPNLLDPLGRPSALAKNIIFSAGEFDRISAELVPKHTELRARIRVLLGVSNDLDALVDKADALAPLAVAANKGTSNVAGAAEPLPKLISGVTDRAREAGPVAVGLGGSVSSVTTQLEGIGSQLDSIHKNLSALGPTADAIAAELAKIEDESARLGPASPLLRLLQGTNGE
ncbi:hypothetical protein ABZV31_37520 [Streptomyces sp. NPDC005202]|uniref:hypothetical protein n=1 Tax=Streptomyces sp. NPDC005202 TaxID=3157021 RepID=UPI0033AEF43E